MTAAAIMYGRIVQNRNDPRFGNSFWIQLRVEFPVVVDWELSVLD